MNNDVKSGILSTEFWAAIAAQVIPLLALSGVISPGDKDTIQGAVINGITAIGALATSAAVVYKYIHSRQMLKVAAMGGDSPASEKKVGDVNVEVK